MLLTARWTCSAKISPRSRHPVVSQVCVCARALMPASVLSYLQNAILSRNRSFVYLSIASKCKHSVCRNSETDKFCLWHLHLHLPLHVRSRDTQCAATEHAKMTSTQDGSNHTYFSPHAFAPVVPPRSPGVHASAAHPVGVGLQRRLPALPQASTWQSKSLEGEQS